MINKTVSRASWQVTDIDFPKKIGIDILLTARQFKAVKKGLLPEQMEDKWFIFFENGWLFMHRSWTGFGIFKAEIVPMDKDYLIRELWAERNEKKYSNTNDQADAEMFLNLIAGGLLGLPVEWFMKKNGHETESDLQWIWSTYGRLPMPAVVHGTTDDIRAALFGVSAGDALGVPAEFENRQFLKQNPVREMTGHGSHNQLPGTWSDDSSLTFCLAEALTKGYNLGTVAEYFINWYYFGYWSARKVVFDVGITTQQAIVSLRNDVRPELAGSDNPDSNGNGSLMRILPLLFYMLDMPVDRRFELTRQVSSMTHRHIRSVIACFYYLEFARQILQQREKAVIYADLQYGIPLFLKDNKVDTKQIDYFDRLLKGKIGDLPEDEISSDGYVLHTLEASIWCLMTTDNFRDAVLKAVNLGGDTDTTGAVTGGLAGLYYGLESIPEEWIKQLARHEEIDDLAERLAGYLENHNEQ